MISDFDEKLLLINREQRFDMVESRQSRESPAFILTPENYACSIAQHEVEFGLYQTSTETMTAELLSRLQFAWMAYGRAMKNIPYTDSNSLPKAREGVSQVTREYIGQFGWIMSTIKHM